MGEGAKRCRLLKFEHDDDDEYEYEGRAAPLLDSSS